MSSVIILQRKNDFGDKINEFLSAEVLGKAHQMQKDTLRFEKSVTSNISESIKKTLKDFQNAKITKNAARIQLLSLAEETEGCEKNIIMAVDLPAINDLDIKNFGESHLSASYIHPLVQALFSLNHSNRVAHCSNTMIKDVEDTNKRPNYDVDIYEHYRYGYTSCYGEVKNSTSSNTDRVMDFYRLSVFAKGVMETHNLNNVLFFQAVGLEITFYVMASPCSTLRAAIELGAITIPAVQKDLLNFLPMLDTLLSVVTLHNSINKNPDSNVPGSSSPTIPYEFIQTKTTLAKKRKSSLYSL